MDLYRLLPPEGVKILLVLFLSFLTGLEREERRGDNEQLSFGGVRTFPLIGLIGYGISLLAGGQILPVTAGFAVVAAFLLLSYRQQAPERRPRARLRRCPRWPPMWPRRWSIANNSGSPPP